MWGFFTIGSGSLAGVLLLFYGAIEDPTNAHLYFAFAIPLGILAIFLILVGAAQAATKAATPKIVEVQKKTIPKQKKKPTYYASPTLKNNYYDPTKYY